MAAEARRGCGFRKIGGTYLECDAGGFECGVIPLELAPCPLCDHRPPFTRGLQRITPRTILHQAKPCAAPASYCERCPLGKAMEQETSALMWVGDRFYTPVEFSEEANRLGISKRIPSVPKWLEIGKTWIFLAHAKVFADPVPSPVRRESTLMDTIAGRALRIMALLMAVALVVWSLSGWLL